MLRGHLFKVLSKIRGQNDATPGVDKERAQIGDQTHEFEKEAHIAHDEQMLQPRNNADGSRKHNPVGGRAAWVHAQGQCTGAAR